MLYENVAPFYRRAFSIRGFQYPWRVRGPGTWLSWILKDDCPLVGEGLVLTAGVDTGRWMRGGWCNRYSSEQFMFLNDLGSEILRKI